MAYNFFTILHEFFFFLSTPSGILFRSSLELLLFILVTYMILSEYSREKIAEYRYLSMAFSILALQRMITSIIHAYIVFGNLNLFYLQPYIPVVHHFLEAFAFILLGNAFIYPYKKDIKIFVFSVQIEILLLFIITVFIEVLWLRSFFLNQFSEFTQFYGFPVFNLIKATLLCYPVYFIIKRMNRIKKIFRYRYSIMLAFLLYAVVPITQTVSYFIYGDINPKIEVFANPFPFFSVMLFTKVVYLKLVDKATLKDKLRESEARYKVAKELSEMKEGFVSVVSHELRTPLTSMKLYTKLLTQGKFGELSKKQRGAVGIIEQETDRLSNLINDILHLSKLESKKESLKIEPFDFYNFSKNHHIYGLAKEKGLKIKVKVPRNFVIDADIEKFKLVFINLVGNAIKFTDRGSINIIGKESRDNWRITIKDTGVGISKENTPKLFDKFFQIESYMTRHRGGTGLGLTIAKKIVDMHNGTIEVKSEVGRGSEFIVAIPKILSSG